MKIESAGGTHIGKVRANNEDNFYINGYYKKNTEVSVKAAEDSIERDWYTYAVCDGMGGESRGEVASLMALEILEKQDQSNTAFFSEYVQKANETICEEMRLCGGNRMGTTLALLHLKEGHAAFCNLGDSRIYRWREGTLTQLSRDHTRAEQLVRAGILSEKQARNSDQRHILTQHLGVFQEEFLLEPETGRDLVVRKKDIFLLSSDGLTDMLDDWELEALLTDYQDESPKKMVNELICRALDKGGRDNLSVIVVKAL